MGGFWFPHPRLGMGAYNRERKATAMRKFPPKKHTLRHIGPRVPIGNRIGRAAAALTLETMNSAQIGDDFVTLGGCVPFHMRRTIPLPQTERRMR